ncbi:MAG TPA: hypothetical protein VK909_11075 [Anaerolineales bacterium]|jgi:hypothetical protein|nr:hypothetical protein [Anaerolineales bacterium]
MDGTASRANGAGFHYLATTSRRIVLVVALKPGRTIQVGHNGKDYEFGVILDPQSLIKALQSK